MSDPGEAAVALEVIRRQLRALRWQVPLLIAFVAILWISRGRAPWGLLGLTGVLVGTWGGLRRSARANRAVVDAAGEANTGAP